MQVPNAPLLFAPALRGYCLEEDKALPVYALVMETPVEIGLDVAGLGGECNKAMIYAPIYEDSALTISSDHGGRDMGLLQHVGLLFPDNRLQVVQATGRSDNVSANPSLLGCYLALHGSQGWALLNTGTNVDYLFNTLICKELMAFRRVFVPQKKACWQNVNKSGLRRERMTRL